MLHICGVSKTFGEWYQKTNKTEDTNKLTHYVRLFGGNKIGNLIFLLPSYIAPRTSAENAEA
jgi:hypothetical protein